MDIIPAIMERRSYRKFKDLAVPDDLLGALVEAGSHAPSAGDLQSWKFVVVKDQSKKNKISELADGQTWISSAPALIVVCSDESIIKKFYKTRSDILSIQNCSAAAQNILLTAHSLGLGACWIGGFEKEAVSEEVGAPGGSAQVMIAVGYPDEKLKKKKVRPLKEVMSLESYGSGVKSISNFLYDWSSVMQQEVSEMVDDVHDILAKELKSSGDELSKKWKKISKNISERMKTWIRRKF